MTANIYILPLVLYSLQCITTTYKGYKIK